jgi:hypothetical protein
MKPVVPKPQRCAIYTRKSTEHNLDLEFNSLDAQREACEAISRARRMRAGAWFRTTMMTRLWTPPRRRARHSKIPRRRCARQSRGTSRTRSVQRVFGGCGFRADDAATFNQLAAS